VPIYPGDDGTATPRLSTELTNTISRGVSAIPSAERPAQALKAQAPQARTLSGTAPTPRQPCRRFPDSRPALASTRRTRPAGETRLRRGVDGAAEKKHHHSTASQTAT